MCKGNVFKWSFDKKTNIHTIPKFPLGLFHVFDTREKVNGI